jgi:hypothetical protein
MSHRTPLVQRAFPRHHPCTPLVAWLWPGGGETQPSMAALQLRPTAQVFGSAKSGFRGVTAALQRLSIAQAPVARSSLVVEGERGGACCRAGRVPACGALGPGRRVERPGRTMRGGRGEWGSGGGRAAVARRRGAPARRTCGQPASSLASCMSSKLPTSAPARAHCLLHIPSCLLPVHCLPACLPVRARLLLQPAACAT